MLNDQQHAEIPHKTGFPDFVTDDDIAFLEETGAIDSGEQFQHLDLFGSQTRFVAFQKRLCLADIHIPAEQDFSTSFRHFFHNGKDRIA